MEIYEIQCRQFVEIFLSLRPPPPPPAAIFALWLPDIWSAEVGRCEGGPGCVPVNMWAIRSLAWTLWAPECSGTGGMSNVKCWAQHISCPLLPHNNQNTKYSGIILVHTPDVRSLFINIHSLHVDSGPMRRGPGVSANRSWVLRSLQSPALHVD